MSVVNLTQLCSGAESSGRDLIMANQPISLAKPGSNVISAPVGCLNLLPRKLLT